MRRLRKGLAGIVGVGALLFAMEAATACSVHGSIAAGMVQDYLRGKYGGGMAGIQVEGWQHNSPYGHYYTRVTLPDGNSMTFYTPWGRFGDGTVIEYWLRDQSVNLIQSYFSPRQEVDRSTQEFSG